MRLRLSAVATVLFGCSLAHGAELAAKGSGRTSGRSSSRHPRVCGMPHVQVTTALFRFDVESVKQNRSEACSEGAASIPIGSTPRTFRYGTS